MRQQIGIYHLIDVLFPDAEQIQVGLDNFITHSPGALYQTFLPQEALQILSKLQFHYTPKHGSWLNIVELEFSVLSRQCRDRRIPIIEEVQQDVFYVLKRRYSLVKSAVEI